jgi:peptidase E
MKGTALVYSSHNRGHYLHDHFIVQRALRGQDNRRILFLPMSESVQGNNEQARQEFAWGNFRWFFSQYDQYGLEYLPFYWTSSLRYEDVETLWHYLYTSEVVILGGGHSMTGLYRYKELGERFAGERGKFGRILHERKARGLLTVGFSAGADQLCENTFRATYDQRSDTRGFGLVRNTMVTLHHDPSRNDELQDAALRFRHDRLFGLPNDAGLNVDWGTLPSGNTWQVYEFVIDNSWDDPSDGFHIRTRSGAKVEHFDPNGRHWSFGGGDYLVRVQSPDGRYDEAWMTSGGLLLNYWTRHPSRYSSISDVLASH